MPIEILKWLKLNSGPNSLLILSVNIFNETKYKSEDTDGLMSFHYSLKDVNTIIETINGSSICEEFQEDHFLYCLVKYN